jgi:hypothetical protein
MIGAAARFRERREDWRRHVEDLQTNTYEGVEAREQREIVFARAFVLTTPVALRVLESLAAA